MKMYRNYDGKKSTFGDTSICAAVTEPGPGLRLCRHARVGRRADPDGDQQTTTASASATVSLANFLPAGTARYWQLTSANTITRLSDMSFSGSSFTSTVPAQSITLFVLPAASPASGPASNPSPANGADGRAHQLQA